MVGCCAEHAPSEQSGGIVFLDTNLLKPFADEKSVELYERRTKSGEIYIAVKTGLLLLGVILPVRVINETFIEMLSDLTNLSIYEWEQEKQAKEAGTWNDATDLQISLFRSEDEGDEDDDDHV